jgi:hypothetical protein
MAKKKNSGYLKNLEQNSGIGRNEKKKITLQKIR